MKKTLIAMAVLAAAGAASAQSSVSLYGRIDAGLQQSTKETTTGSVTTKDKVMTAFGGQDSVTGSRFGITGSEDLGGGLKGLFTYELGMNLDRWSARSSNVTNATPFGLVRQAFIGLQGGFGLIKIGTQYNATDWVHAVRPDIASSLTNNFVNNEGEGYIASATRTQDALSYAGTFNVGGSNTVSFGLGATQGNRTQTASSGSDYATKGQGLTGGVGFNAFGADVRMSYSQYKGQQDAIPAATTLPTSTPAIALPVAASDVKAKDFSLGLKYEIAGVRPYFIYEQGKVYNNLAVAGASDESRKRVGMELGVGATFGAVDAWADYFTGKAQDAKDTTEKSKGFGLGAQYNLSKRTGVYGIVTRLTGTKYAPATPTAAYTESGSSKNQTVGLGLIHKF